MLFTPWTKQVNTHPDVSIDNVLIPLCRNSEIMGVTFDSLFNFSYHAVIAAKASRHLNLLKAVSGSSWGHDKETLLMTCKALVESVYSYHAAIWFPNCKPTNVAKLQFIQNAAIRLITGCYKATFIAHLRDETKLLPVAEHLTILYIQFLASCMRPSHPSHETVRLPPGPRKNQHGRPLKETLSSHSLDALTPHLREGIIPEANYMKVKSDVHTLAVAPLKMALNGGRKVTSGKYHFTTLPVTTQNSYIASA
jgi:hypothetical protein